MNNQLDDNMSNHETDTFKDNFEDEIRQSYHDLSEKLPLPPSNSFSRIMDTIKKEERSNIKQPLLSRIIQFFQETIITPKAGWALAGVQLAVLVFLVFSPGSSDINNFKTLSINTTADKGMEINIVFKETALQKDIRQLLINSGAVIINGPTEGGLYILKVKQGHDLAIRLQTIENSKIVKFVSKRY